MQHATQSAQSEPKHQLHDPDRNMSLAPPASPSRIQALLSFAARVILGVAVLSVAAVAQGGEPELDVTTVRVTAASAGTGAFGMGPGPTVLEKATCPPDECSPLDDEPEVGPEQTSQPQDSRQAVPHLRVDRSKGRVARLRSAGDRQLGLRILDPLYAIVSMPRRPEWSPSAERPIVQRILVGFRFVVPF